MNRHRVPFVTESSKERNIRKNKTFRMTNECFIWWSFLIENHLIILHAIAHHDNVCFFTYFRSIQLRSFSHRLLCSCSYFQSIDRDLLAKRFSFAFQMVEQSWRIAPGRLKIVDYSFQLKLNYELCDSIFFFFRLTDNLFMFTPNNINCLVTFNVFAII